MKIRINNNFTNLKNGNHENAKEKKKNKIESFIYKII